MCTENPSQIPFLDFSKDPRALEQGTEEWGLLCKEVRAACETHGYFCVAYNKIPMQVCEEMFGAMKPLFDLPLDIKMKSTSPKPFYGYAGVTDITLLYESTGVDGAPRLEMAQASTDLMWPNGNPSFCQTLHTISMQMLELTEIIRKMIFDSFGVSKHYDLHGGDCDLLFRMLKYKAPMKDDLTMGLVPHTDKRTVTILCQDGVQGFQMLSKEGEWLDVTFSKGSLIVIVGEALKAWSNGRLHAVNHRVMLSGDKERFTCGLFPIPKEGVMIEVPRELIDKDHPLIFKPFKYMDYMRYLFSDINEIPGEDALEKFAGI